MINSRTLAHTLISLAEKHGDERGYELFSDYLTQKNLRGLLPQVLHYIQDLEKNAQQGNILSISSRFPLSSEEIQEIKKITKATADDVIVETYVDEKVVGGFSASFDGYSYNGSLDNTLQQFKKVIAS